MNASIERLGTSATGLILGLLLALLAACGGGSGGPDAPVASRIEAGPQSVLLVAAGDSRTLSAQRIDAAGAPLAGAVSWASSDPALVSVDSAGTVRALAGAGSARVTASSGALQSAAVLVTIAQPVAGAQLLADSQVVSGPTPVDATAEPASGNAYEVVLRGAPLLTAGTIVIASESANVAGRVVSVQPEGADQRVRLVAVPPNQLFSSFDFNDTVDLAQGPFEIPADLAATYDVVQTGSTFAFTPKPGTLRSQDRKTAAAATGTSALGPLPPFKECEASADFGSGLPVPLALSAAPSFEVTIDGSARREANAQGTRFIVTGSPKFKLASVLEIRSAFEAKIGCKLTLVTRKFRVPGWAGLFFGGDVEFGVGFEVGGKVTLASAKVGGTAALNSTVEATLNCPAAPGNCTLEGSSSAQTQLTPVLQAPALEQAQFEPSVNLFGFVSLEAGNADVQQLQFKAIEIKAGAELAAGLTTEALQIANLDAETGRSKYALAFKGDVGPGVKLGEFLAFVGLAEVVPLKLAFAVDLGISPSATSVVADRSSYLPGERATVTVKLAPASTLFPSGFFYNVERVVLRRTSGPFSTEVLAEQAATAGQTDFTLGFDSAALLNAGEIFAFVVTKALPLDPPTLELGAAQAAVVVSPIVLRTRLSAVEARARTQDEEEVRNQLTFNDFGNFSSGQLTANTTLASATADQTSSVTLGADGSLVIQMSGSAQAMAQGQDLRVNELAQGGSVFEVNLEVRSAMSFTSSGQISNQRDGNGATAIGVASFGDAFQVNSQAGAATPLNFSGVLSPGFHRFRVDIFTEARPNFSVESASVTLTISLTLTP